MLGDRVGAASGLKMCTASVYKGDSALLTHACRTAPRTACSTRRSPTCAAVPCLVEAPERWIATAASKAERYVAEMREIAATQSGAGLPAELFEAMAEVYGAFAESELAAEAPGVDSARRPRLLEGRARARRPPRLRQCGREDLNLQEPKPTGT